MSILTTGKKDKNGKEIKEGDTLVSYFGYEYLVKFGEFSLSYTSPFPISCLGFYIEYINPESKKFTVDSFLILALNNVEIKN